jgi:hypothetical protein
MQPSHVKPSLCLIGTSNGVFEDGYSKVFRDSSDLRSFSKNCIGYCSSALFALKAPSLDFGTFDICVLDFAVNDGIQLQQSMASPEIVYSSVADAVHRILSASCLPVLLILPVLSVFKAATRTVRDIYLRIADRYNLPVFDCYRYLEELAARGHAISPLFDDDMHLRRDIAVAIAELCLEGALVAHRISASGPRISGVGWTYRYLSVTETRRPGGQLRQPKSSLFTTHISDITESGCLPIDIGGEAEITAIGLDWANSRGKLSLGGQAGRSFSVSTAYSGDDQSRFVFGLFPMVGPVEILDKSVSLLLESDGSGAARIGLGGFIIRQQASYDVSTMLSEAFFISDAFVRAPIKSELRNVNRWDRPLFYFKGLEKFLARPDTYSGIYSIKILDTFFDLFVENNHAPATVVHFHPAIPDRSGVGLPIFLGQAIEGASPNVVHVSDPGLYLSATMPIAWFAGIQGCPIQLIMHQILKSLSQSFGQTKLIFTGTSGGGFAALYYGHGFPHSLSLVSNPQTKILNFEYQAIHDYCHTCFGTVDKEGIKRVLDRIIVSDLVALYSTGFENFVLYAQNTTDVGLETHLKPFLSALPKELLGRVAVLHGEWGHGHIPPPASLWARLLGEAIAWPGGWAEFVEMADLYYLGLKLSLGKQC